MKKPTIREQVWAIFVNSKPEQLSDALDTLFRKFVVRRRAVGRKERA